MVEDEIIKMAQGQIMQEFIGHIKVFGLCSMFDRKLWVGNVLTCILKVHTVEVMMMEQGDDDALVQGRSRERDKNWG